MDIGKGFTGSHVVHAHDVLVFRATLAPAASDAGDAALRSSRLLAIATEFTSYAELQFKLKAYIWQRDAFELGVLDNCDLAPPTSTKTTVAENPTSRLPVLGGRLAFGDNVDDEWFAVFLLFQMSRRYPELIVHMEDTDGDFLLIEAALVIPRWIKPTNSKHRVLVRNGRVHIVPKASPANGLPRKLTFHQAVSAVASSSLATVASEEVQQCIAARLAPYPRKALESTHTARCKLPIRVAKLLHADPALVAPAVTAFYARDSLDNTRAATMRVFPPEPSVMMMVRFSRCLFAQLTQQAFHPPKPFRKGMVGETHPDHVAHLNGMKLACGFEMLAHRQEGVTMPPPGSSVDNETKSEHESSASAHSADDLARVMSGQSWVQFKAALVRNGFFKDMPEGSVRYKAQEREAARALLRSSAGAAVEEKPHPCVRMAALLQHLPVPKEWPPPTRADDDDAWLRTGASQLEDALARQQRELAQFQAQAAVGGGGGAGGASDGDAMRRGVDAANDVVKSLSAFVGEHSDFRGVEPSQPPKGRPQGNKPARPQPAAAETMDAGRCLSTTVPAHNVWVFADGADSDGGSTDEEEAGLESTFSGPTVGNRGVQVDASDSDDSDDSDSSEDISFDVDTLVQVLGGVDLSASTTAATATHTAAPTPASAPASSVVTPASVAPAVSQDSNAEVADETPSTSQAPSSPPELPPSAEHVTEEEQDPSFGDVMAAMDAQLRHSTMVKSFKRVGDPIDVATATATATGVSLHHLVSSDEEEDSDDDLTPVGAAAASAMDPSRPPLPPPAATVDSGADDAESSDGELAPVDVDFNLVSNLLASVSGQQGQAGPGSNLLGELGVSWKDVVAE